MRYSSDHKAQTRERILQVAAAAIRTHGIERVSLAEIMADAELTNGGFYAHFKSKDELIAEAIAYMFDERYASLLARLHTLNPKEALTAFIDYYLSMRHRDAPERGCPLPALAADVPHMSRDARLRFSAGVTRVTDALTMLLDRAGVADAKVQASSILAELVGALNLARTAERPADAKAMLAASRGALEQRLGLGADR